MHRSFCMWQDKNQAFHHGKALWLWTVISHHSLHHHGHLFPTLTSPAALQQTISFSTNSCTHLSFNSHSRSAEQQYSVPLNSEKHNHPLLVFDTTQTWHLLEPVLGKAAWTWTLLINLYDHMFLGLTSTIVWLPLKASSMQGPNLFSASESRNFFVL